MGLYNVHLFGKNIAEVQHFGIFMTIVTIRADR